MNENKSLIDINENPLDLFNKWFAAARLKEINNPNAMNLATVSSDLQPTSRMVLLKSFNVNGFVFYTNLSSKKGEAIKKNSRVALNFYWKSTKRQVHIEGKAKIIDNEDSDKYFETRNKESQRGAWASKQSYELNSRNELESRFEELIEKYKDKAVPRPDYWTGFKVEPVLIEFWQHMPFRLHDRVEYKKKGKSWLNRRLFP